MAGCLNGAFACNSEFIGWLDLTDQIVDNSNMELSHSPVISDPEVLGGTIVFVGTRVPAQTLLDYISDGFSVQQFLEYFPSVHMEDAVAFLELVHRKAS